MNTGHDELHCEDCHKETAGTFRQKLQANIQYLLGKRFQSVSIGYHQSGNETCLACHARPKDRHSVYRFEEPRFREVRSKIAPHLCVSCHREHSGKRVTVGLDICQHCHEKIAVRKDKIEPGHAELARQKRWSTCLGCHDFHGNHRMQTSSNMQTRISEEALTGYLNGGQSVYPAEKYYKAKRANEYE
jgi:ribosomal protein L37AE/L43A